jgi:hypothetical protein
VKVVRVGEGVEGPATGDGGGSEVRGDDGPAEELEIEEIVEADRVFQCYSP